MNIDQIMPLLIFPNHSYITQMFLICYANLNVLLIELILMNSGKIVTLVIYVM